MTPTTRNKFATQQKDATNAAPATKRKRAATPKSKKTNAVATTAADVSASAEDINQKKKRIIQDRKNDYKRRNRLRDEAFEIVYKYKANRETIWQALLSAINDFLEKNESKKISEAQVFRMCAAHYSLRFHHAMELDMTNYEETRRVGMDFYCPSARDWLIIFKKIDVSLIEQSPSEKTMLAYMEMRARKERS
ncbi:hypothetical protein V8B55DRAFT_1407587 [Mucor lusitanicus]|uniref:Uncharacterized protein n=1 Tax=Mucor lusitanicus CBS 277.49 TaxID=747725 RepID=A0A168K4W9_MUCCL|nr:hypothetical protein MUCCIDRAFT_82384 [Mucor lusitanicus CBS 277.49]